MANSDRRRFLKGMLGTLAGGRGHGGPGLDRDRAATGRRPAPEPQPDQPGDIQERAEQIANAAGADRGGGARRRAFVNGGVPQRGGGGGFRNGGFANGGGGGFRNGGFANGGRRRVPQRRVPQLVNRLAPKAAPCPTRCQRRPATTSGRSNCSSSSPRPFCNLDCSYCYLPDRSDTRRMSLDDARPGLPVGLRQRPGPRAVHPALARRRAARRAGRVVRGRGRTARTATAPAGTSRSRSRPTPP